jgi:hypothetical protein
MHRSSGILLSLVLVAGCVEQPTTDVSSAALAPGPDADLDGYDAAHDCDDLDRAIHPHTRELANGIDDNCAAGVDEPMLSYARTRPAETATYAQLAKLSLRITDAATIAYLNAGGTVRYHFLFQRLSDATTPAYQTPQESMTITPFTTWRAVADPATGEVTRTLIVDPNHPARGLQPRTVYRFTIQLHTAAGLDLGPPSDWFYVVSGGTTASPSGTLQQGRVDLALVAFDQLGDSEDGLIGKRGTVLPDGVRFTASNMVPLHESYHPRDDTGWCDWFYHYVGAVVTDGVDGAYASNVVVDGGTAFWHAMNPNNVPNAFSDVLNDGCGTENDGLDLDGDGFAGGTLMKGCADYLAGTVTLDGKDRQLFKNIPGNFYYDAVQSLPANQAVGNYQAMDGHAGMFLAFDPNGDGGFGAGGPGDDDDDAGDVGGGGAGGGAAVGTVWSIEGNVGDHVRVMHRAADNPVINGFGKLTVGMFQ